MAVAVRPDMPINILPALNGIEISCNKPYYDGFSPDNLLLVNSQGFMTERFVKPPAIITVKLPCSVRIQAISFHNTVRSFTSSSFEITSYGLAADKEPSNIPIYKPVGRCYDSKPGTIQFTNNRYKVDSKYTVNSADQTFPLSSSDSTLLNSARHLRIHITRTLNGSMPVLKDLAIIGYPLSCHSLISKSQLPETKPSSSKSKHVVDELMDQPLLWDAPDETPKEFLDPLTCNLMLLPVILPSGYTIDQHTLNKHIEMEKDWGRKPSDPFTGMSLDSTNPPVSNHLLKERIDRFVLVNGIKSGRTLGSKRRVPSSECGTQEPNIKQPCLGVDNFTSVSASRTEPDNYNTCQDPDRSTDSSESKVSSSLSKILAKSSNLRTVKLPTTHTIDCSFCSSNKLCDTILYQLNNCKHLLCRNCLELSATNETIACSKCRTVTLRSQITRYHSV